MDTSDWELAAALYFPVTLAIIARLLCGRRPRQFAACLLSALWVFAALLALQKCNQFAAWWSFGPGSAVALLGMPLELYLGWIVLWGLIPNLALAPLSLTSTAVVLAALDCLLMPLTRPLIMLKPHWFIGEAAAICFVLIPALCLGRWTLAQTHLRARALLQLAISALLFLFAIPETAFALGTGHGWASIRYMPRWASQFSWQAVLLLALPGVSAVLEFAERGQGTPIPYDPPRRLVTSGIYRYCANPMQVSCVLVMICWAGMLENVWLLAAPCVAVLYSAGIANWDEKRDLDHRFGQSWREYRSCVKSWRFRVRPYHAGAPAAIYLARTCGPCSEIREWLKARNPQGLAILDAESLPARSIPRLRYDPQDGAPTVEGVRAIGRALEHLHFGWALFGSALRLPLLWQVIQLLMDAAGLGPRVIVANQCGTEDARDEFPA